MCAEVSYVDREVEFVEEVAVFRLVHHVVDIVGAEGEAVVVGLAVVTADDTVLCEVAEREVVVNFFSSAGDGEVVVHDRSVVVEHHVLPVPAAAYDGVAVGVGEVVRIGVSGSLTAVNESLVLKDGVVGGVGNVAFFSGGLPAVREVVVDLGFALFTFFGGNEDYTVGSTGTVDCAGSSILEHFDGLDVVGVDKVKAATDGHTVYDVEGVGVVDGTCTTDAHAGSFTGLTGRRCNVHTCGKTFEGVVETYGSLVCKVVSVDFCD